MPDTANQYRQSRLDDGAQCLAAALDLQSRGLSVLALCPPDHMGVGKKHDQHCDSPGKCPLGLWKDFQDRRATADELRKKWNDNPTLNVGVALGHVSGIVRLDVEGGAAKSELDRISGGRLPPTWEFKSGRSDGTGVGILYSIPTGIVFKTTGRSFRDGELRFQAKGAQTVLPPSRHKDGGLYQWLPGRAPWQIPIAPAPQWMVDRYREKPPKAFPRSQGDHPDAARVADALRFMSGVDDYDQWLRIGMALHDWDCESGHELWCEWSKDSTKFDEEVCDIKWSSFKSGGGITIATIFKSARDAGWKPPRSNAAITTSVAGKAEANAANDSGDGSVHGVSIILDYFRERYRPVFRRGNSICCIDGADIPMGVACAVPDSALIERLAAAVDAPKYPGGSIKRNGLPGFFKNWCRVAWGDLLATLPDEDTAELAEDAPAREVFRRLVRDAMLSEIALGDSIHNKGVNRVEKRSLIDWCEKFAKTGPWRSIRSKKCWCKLEQLADGELILKVAIRHELFAQLHADKRLCELCPNRFSRRAARYGVGKSTRADRPGGQAVVVLDQEFVADLIGSIDEEQGDEPMEPIVVRAEG